MEEKMVTIWKFPIPITDHFEITMPEGSQVLSFQTQKGEPYIWVLVDPSQLPGSKKFRLAGTGHMIEEEGGYKYIGSTQMMGGDLIWHLFEKVT